MTNMTVMTSKMYDEAFAVVNAIVTSAEASDELLKATMEFWNTVVIDDTQEM